MGIQFVPAAQNVSGSLVDLAAGIPLVRLNGTRGAEGKRGALGAGGRRAAKAATQREELFSEGDLAMHWKTVLKAVRLRWQASWVGRAEGVGYEWVAARLDGRARRALS